MLRLVPLMESLKHFLSYAQTHRSLLEKALSQGLKDVSEIQQKKMPEAGSDCLFFFLHSHLVSSLEVFILCICLSLAVHFSLFLTLSCSSCPLQLGVSSVSFLAVLFIQSDICLGNY